MAEILALETRAISTSDNSSLRTGWIARILKYTIVRQKTWWLIFSAKYYKENSSGSSEI